MSYQIPTIEPATIVAGTTAKWHKSISDFLPSEGTLKYHFTNRGANGFTVTCTDDSGVFLATIAAATTTSLAVGDWYWESAITVTSGEIFPIQSGRTTVKANYSAANSLDNRSHARKCLDIIQAALQGRFVDGVESHSMLGVNVSQIGLAQLVQLEDKYKADVLREIQAERLALGLGGGNMIGVRFNRP